MQFVCGYQGAVNDTKGYEMQLCTLWRPTGVVEKKLIFSLVKITPSPGKAFTMEEPYEEVQKLFKIYQKSTLNDRKRVTTSPVAVVRFLKKMSKSRIIQRTLAPCIFRKWI